MFCYLQVNNNSVCILPTGFHPEGIILWGGGGGGGEGGGGGKLQEVGVALYTLLYSCPKFWGGELPPHQSTASVYICGIVLWLGK